jgi:hypothetical protein
MIADGTDYWVVSACAGNNSAVDVDPSWILRNVSAMQAGNPFARAGQVSAWQVFLLPRGIQ